MKKFAFAGVALAAIAALPAAAQQQAPHAPELTRAALDSHVEARFAGLDADKDGYVTRAELEAKAEARRTERTERRGERRATMFARLDTDKNGSISRAEFDAPRADRGERRGMRAERRGDHAGHGGKRGMRGMRGHGGGLMAGLGLRHFDALDADKDGRLSRAEATARAAAMFDRVDADRNGTVTREERRAARQAMRAERRGG